MSKMELLCIKLPVTDASASSTFDSRFKALNAVDSDKETLWISGKPEADLFLDFKNNDQPYPIEVKKIAFRTYAGRATTFQYTIYGIVEGTSNYVQISNPETRDNPDHRDGAIYINPIRIQYPANTYRYTSIKINCVDLNNRYLVMIHDVVI